MANCRPTTVGLHSPKSSPPMSDVSYLVTFFNIIEPRDILETALDQTQGHEVGVFWSQIPSRERPATA